MSLYTLAITNTLNCLDSLEALLKKGETSPVADKLIDARLYEDMLPLQFQVHFSTDLASKVAHRLTGEEPESLNKDDLKTFADFYARIEHVRAYLKKADKATVDGYATKTVQLGLGPNKPPIDIKGEDYAFAYGLPNLMFHVAQAYAIMRKEGVQLGKMDYLAPFIGPHMPKQ